MLEVRRGEGIAIPAWWLELANEYYRNSDISQRDLGKLLAKIASRRTAWDSGQISRFLAGTNTTRDLADAFSLWARLPPPFYVAKTFAEATAHQEVSAMFARFKDQNKDQNKDNPTDDDRPRLLRNLQTKS